MKIEQPSTQVEPAAGDPAAGAGSDFIRSIVAEDLRTGRHRRIVTRFPPEPNGYLHIGHVKAVSINFGIAAETGGVCYLRFDDTNPETEDMHYVESIIDSIRWLGYDWGEHLYFASDYFERMYAFAQHLIREGVAYVDSLDEDQIREYRGTVTEPGRESPYRSRGIEENLDLFARMRAGEFPDGAHVLRAKIDMASPNMLLRDPVLYRIRHGHHYRTGDDWCIYPLYDWAHPIEDAIEGVTHSLCSIEFENNRPLYDWVVEHIPLESRPRQYEFARLNLDYTVMSKRKLLELVRGGYVSGWDDPRMPTVAGMRRRGFTPTALRNFSDMVGVAKTQSRVDIGKLEFAIRDDLNQTAPRVLCVVDPVKVVLTNYPEDRDEELEAPYYPRDVPREGLRMLPFSREIWIERDDFREDPPKGYYRLSPGAEVRLRYAYIIRCERVVRSETGDIQEIHCTYDPRTRGGTAPEGQTVRGTIHWVSAKHALTCEVRLYDRLFRVPDPEAGEADFKEHLNPDSLVVVPDARIEPSVVADPLGTRYQFERVGYFVSDAIDSTPERLVFNRTVSLRDTWSRQREEAAEKQVERGGARRRAETQKPEETPVRRRPAPPEEPRSPELDALRARYVDEVGVPEEEADLLTRDAATAALFGAALEAERGSPRGIANWIIHELPRELGDTPVRELSFSGRQLAALVEMVETGKLSSSAGREVLAEMVRTGEAPEAIVEREGLRQVSDRSALEPIVADVLEAFPEKAEEYRGGKTGLLGFFIGRVMKRTGGSANPELVGQILRERLGG